jgi:hypothetical protein
MAVAAIDMARWRHRCFGHPEANMFCPTLEHPFQSGAD